MKRYRKKELQNMAVFLERTNDAMAQKDAAGMSDRMDALAKCQELALEMGNELERRGAPGESIVPILEDYCETLYQMSLALSDGNLCRKLSKIIRRQLTFVKTHIQQDLPEDKKEIVFLPYKASMWDSLESIWKAESEDSNQETFVIPIPYYDKNPDGSFDQMHEEGDQYPDYVPITSWREYNIADRRPDVIYIHNPYDEFNHVTSVHPAFYAKELRKYTDKLIYVPYFICVNDNVKEEFCILPGVVYADEVILQSQKVRAGYLEIYHRWEDEQECRDCFGKAEEKFLALGSPKLDKVSTSQKEDFVIPQEWQRRIRREDGSSKKVILYNTSVVKMLENSEEMLEKIKDVLGVFRKHTEVVLLWRPHPLLRATIQSMRKEFLQEYDDIVETYRREGWGIYDDSADLHRAIALSDAYYGDGSSVVELYKCTGKPMMIQDMRIRVKKSGKTADSLEVR